MAVDRFFNIKNVLVGKQSLSVDVMSIPPHLCFSFKVPPGIDTLICDLAIDFQGQSFVTVDKGGNICRWDIRYLMWKTKPQVDTISVGFHPEGRAITAGGTNGKLLVLHSDGGLVVATIFVADAALKALAYNTDGSVLAVGCEDGNVYVCGSKNRGYLYKIHAVLKNEWPILQIDWSDDGEYLQSCYRKEDFCEVALWKVAESKRITSALSQNRNWPQHTCTLSHNILGIWNRIEGVFYLSCHRNGSKLATGAKDGFIRIYPYPYPEADQCALWAGGIIGDRYRAMITNFFIPELNNHDVQELWFQQDGATCHTARATIDLLKDTFGDRLISRFGPVNLPPRSCDLTPLDYFLWGYVKSLVYADKPQTLDHLEDNIRRVIADIRPQMLEKVIENWTSRLDYIRASRGSPMP
ncbi:echinoderm microtubule-associated protein-like CG42247 [Trichonephila clavipes]|nr:echinoderm microtubule-associated protein-like CG42247 [Trichonephila clavipes]